MGERLLCKQEVIGSIPFTSTILLVGRAREWRFQQLGKKFLIATPKW